VREEEGPREKKKKEGRSQFRRGEALGIERRKKGAVE